MTRIFRCTIAAVMLLVANVATAQRPVATLPAGITISGGAYVGTVMDTTYSLPTGGTTWAVHNATQFSSALNGSAPGDVIVLDAGTVYSSSYFTLPAKTNPNHKWIYVISSQLASLPAGTRVSPASAVYMPKITATGSTSPVVVGWGANYWRFAGIEFYGSSNYPTGCGVTGHPNCMSYQLMGVNWAQTYAIPDHIWLDRIYGHGDATHDIQTAFEMNWTWGAIIDSWVDNVHNRGTDSQAVALFNSLGPVKITNDELDAAGENVMFGGSGQNYNSGVPCDIEVRFNHMYKPLAWIPLSVPSYQSQPNSMVVKDIFEFKSGCRALVDNNVFENSWVAGQLGNCFDLTVRSGQSGDFAVVNDITITNNWCKNVVAGFNDLSADDTCDNGTEYPACGNAGSQDRWYIVNNLFTLFDPTLQGGGYQYYPFELQPGYDHVNGHVGQMRDIVFQHNTAIPATGNSCWAGVYFGIGGLSGPPSNGLTTNIWILDNVLCGEATGSWGSGTNGVNALYEYMGLPSASPYDYTARFRGNLIYGTHTYPANNLASSATFTYDSNHQLLTPNMTGMTSDGTQAGYSIAGIVAPPTYSLTVTVTGPCAVGTPLALTGALTQSGTTDSTGTYVFQGLSNGAYTVTPTSATCTVTPTSQSVTVSGSNQTTSFVTAPLHFTMSGTVTGPAAVGATITLAGPSPTAVATDVNGNFTASGLLAGTYTVTPSEGQFQFAPAFQTVVVSTANVTGINFVSTPPPQYSISGTIAGAGVGTMIYVIGTTGQPVGTTLTGMNGGFAFGSLFVNGTYTVRPSSTCNTFTPPTQAVTVGGANLTGVNFTAH